jgi:hypothetical protein
MPRVDIDWDQEAAEGRVRAWANRGDGMDWAKYRRAFCHVDIEDPNEFDSYHLIHHDIRDGQLVTVRKGVMAAMEELLDEYPEWVPEHRHLARHYEEFGMTAPPPSPP